MPTSSSDRSTRSLPEPEEERYGAIRRELVRAVTAVCPYWLRDRSEDLVQNALLRVYNLERDGRRQLATSYLWRVAYSATVDEMRRSAVRPEVPLPETHDLDPPGRGSDPASQSAGRELGEAIAFCLGAMVPARSRAVALHLYGHTVPQAARLLGWPRKRVENLVYRGLADLRRCLRQKGLEP